MNRQNELIEEYLSGKLSGKELVDFENQVTSDPSLASDIEDHKMVQELIHLRGLMETRDKLDQIKIRKLAEATKWNRIKWWGGIATVLTIASISSYTYFTSKDSNTSKPNSFTESSTSSTIQVDTTHEHHQHIPFVLPNRNGNKTVSNGPTQTNQFSDVMHDTTFVNVITSEDRLVSSENNSLPTEIKKDSVKKNTAGTPNDPCLNITINGDIKTENTCTGVSNGKLFISNVRGGTGPYLYSLQCLTNNSVYASGTTINYWDNMEAGSYKVIISDANKCSTEVFTDIKTKYCETGKKSIFNPDLGEVWTYPVKPNSNGTIRIYDSGGVLVFETTIKNNYPSNWEGRGKDGALLNAGGYVYQVLYEDGTYDQGSVTIAR